MSAVWNIYTAVILRRPALVLSEINIIERRVQSVFENYERIQSRLSDHELRHKEDLLLAKKMASEQNITDEDIEAAAKQTAQDFEDACMKEKSEFKFGKITKDEDRDFMLVQSQKFGSDIKNQWLLPQAKHEDGEQLIDTARRALTQSIGMDYMLKCRFLGTVPTSVYSFNYPKKFQLELKAKGAKIFFMKAFAANLFECKQQSELQWLTRDQCSKIIHSSYWNRVQQALVSEIRVDPQQVLDRVFRRRIEKINVLKN